MTTIGQTLAAAREQSGYTLAEISDRTRIRRTVLAALERDDFAPCGGDFYARGHIRAVCREIGIDSAPLIAQFNERNAEGAPLPTAPRIDSGSQRPDPETAEPEAAEPEMAGAAAGPDETAAAAQHAGPAGPHPDLDPDPDQDPARSGGRGGSHAAPESSEPRRRVWPLMVAAAIVMAAVIAGVQAWPEGGVQWNGGILPITKDTGAPEPRTPAPEEQPEPESTNAEGAAGDPQEAQRPQESHDDVRVRLHAHDRVWVRVTDADGGDVFTGVLTDGSKQDWSHSDELRMRLGDAGAAQIELNGQQLGTPGPNGEAANLVFDSEGMRNR